MKSLIAALLFLPSLSFASPYFRLLDLSHPQVGAGFLIAPKDPLSSIAVTELALLTHSAADGSIVPASWQSVLPPESWVPLQAGFGGSFNGELTLEAGSSANIAPVVGSLLLRGVDQNSSGWAAAIKSALVGSPDGGIRLGGALAGITVKNGVFQSAKEAFPGQGFLEIVSNAARVDFGYAWKF